MPSLAIKFGMDSLMLIIALIAGCATVMRESTPMGVLLSFLCASAMGRTMLQIARSEDERMSTFDKMIAFFVSVAISILIGVPALIAFGISSVICDEYHLHPFLLAFVQLASAIGVGYAAHRLVPHLLRQ